MPGRSSGSGSFSDPRVGVVVATRDRRQGLVETLERLGALPERPAVVVVDNGSMDGSAEAVRRAGLGAQVVRLPFNRGAAARNVGTELLSTPYVAFSDDDSWWAPGSLRLAADVLDAFPRVALLAGRVLVGPEERLDPVCAAMANSPLRSAWPVPGPPVLGFIACGAVVRRIPFLEAGGFHPRLEVGCEEELLAASLAAADWDLAYVHRVVAHHHPSTIRDPRSRRRMVVRNSLWSAWLRRRMPGLVRRTTSVVASAIRDPIGRAGLLDAAAGLPWVLRERRPIPRHVERRWRIVERTRGRT